MTFRTRLVATAVVAILLHPHAAQALSTAAGAGAAAGAGSTAAASTGLGLAGFTATGIAKGSIAAAVQSTVSQLSFTVNVRCLYRHYTMKQVQY